MKIEAQVKVINEAREGISQSTGNPWKAQDIVIGWQEPRSDGSLREQRLAVTLHGQSVDRFRNQKPIAGATLVEGDLSFTTETYNGKVYNRVALFL